MTGMTIEELEPLEDPRHGNAECHSLHDILVIALCTIHCGGETCMSRAGRLRPIGAAQKRTIKGHWPDKYPH